MKRIAGFEKVSLTQFAEDWKKTHPEMNDEEIRTIYDGIRLPKRATSGSAGYDFYAPSDLVIEAGREMLIPTGIRARIEEGYVLMLFPRSSLGFKYRLQLDNTAGIIDSDYWYADNEGHIMCKLINDSREGKTVSVSAGTAFVQGLFIPFGITEDDDAQTKRTGGIGSTTKTI